MAQDDFLMDEDNYKEGIPMLTNNPQVAADYKGGPVSLIQDEPPMENPDKQYYDGGIVRERMPSQGGRETFSQYRERPPGPKPTDDMLDIFEKRKSYETKIKEQLPDLDIDVVRRAEDDTLAELYRDRSTLLYGRQTREDEARYQAILNRNMQIAMQKQAYARKLYDAAMNIFDQDLQAKRKYEREMGKEALKGEYDLAKQGMVDKQKAEQSKAKEEEQLKNIDLPSLAEAVANGQDAPISIKNTRGANIHAMVKSRVLNKYPKFDFNMADANYKWKQSATNQRTINFAGGALPRLVALDEQLRALPNVNVNAINAVMRGVRMQLGDPVYSDFESNRNAIVQEINTALSGTSQSSDTRLNIELENLKSSRSPQQIAAAVKNLREALIARLEVDLGNIYPQDVVRGEKTMKQYKEELFAKYRGKSREKIILDKLGIPDALAENRIPPRQEYFSAMRKANPKASDQEINAYLDEKGVK